MSDFRPCRECKDWKMCVLTESEREWFGYQHVRFCPVQIFFLLRYEGIMRAKAWPVPDDTAPGGMSTKVLGEADFVKVSLILAELHERLAKTSLKGEVLEAQCKVVDKMEYLSDNAKDALYYVSGDSRKDTDFTTWLRIRRHRYEKRNTPIKCRS